MRPRVIANYVAALALVMLSALVGYAVGAATEWRACKESEAMVVPTATMGIRG